MLKDSIPLILKELLRSKTAPLSGRAWHLMNRGRKTKIRKSSDVAACDSLAFPAQTEHNPRKENDHGNENPVKLFFLLLFAGSHILADLYVRETDALCNSQQGRQNRNGIIFGEPKAKLQCIAHVVPIPVRSVRFIIEQHCQSGQVFDSF